MAALDVNKFTEDVKAIVQSNANPETIDKGLDAIHEIIKPSQPVVDGIWIIISTGFLIVLVGAFFTLAIDSLTRNQNQQLVLAVLTTAAGFLAGLLVPSPVTKQP